MSLKVMLIYPNFKGMNMLPPGVALLSAVLKEKGFEVRLFDTTPYERIDGVFVPDSDKSKSERLMARPYEMPRKVLSKSTNCFEDFEREVLEFRPNLLALSTTEDMFDLGLRLLKKVRYLNILTIAGGVLPTFAPKLILSFPEIDIVCKGEGEDALSRLCECLASGQSYDDISNLWIKKQDGTIKINQTKMVDMDKNPLIDMSIFEEGRYYRPMGGTVYRMFPVETHRGCPYTCAFCNSPSQMEMYKHEEGKSYLRRKTIKNMHRELKFYKEVMGAEYLYFWADTFLSWKKGELEEFAEMYNDIGLPFWCQTRIETITEERLEIMKKMKCARISFGIEHGNEEFRKKHLKRPVTNAMMLTNFKVVEKSGIPFSVNNIMGFPHETVDLAFDTIRFNKHINSHDRNAYHFTPFHGTPLRAEVERLGYVKDEDIVQSFVIGDSLIDMPAFPKKKVISLTKTFNMYVKFPESRWPDIRKAEEDTAEGRKIYIELKEEFTDKFFNSESENFEASALEKEISSPMN
ncbi:MAG: B12-binding domain-containing radical SAM protein [Candidatus Omnitrophica bacterium]|nr:B12-binding domain-containing radical SAM protein [Candidatus Omnitrophota bacterium]